jgi:hypothetical protein
MDFDRLNEDLDYALESLFNVVDTTQEWTSWDNEDQVALSDYMEKLNAVFGILRQPYDSTVWKLSNNGQLPDGVKSVREQPTGDKPGRKAVERTAASVLAAKLGKGK